MPDIGFNLPLGDLTFHVVDRPPAFHLAVVSHRQQLDELNLTPRDVPVLVRLLRAGTGRLGTKYGDLQLEAHYGDVRLTFTGRAASNGTLNTHVVDRGSLVALSHLIWATVAVGSHALLTEALLTEYVWGDWNFGSDLHTAYQDAVRMQVKGTSVPEQQQLLRAELARRMDGTPWVYLLPTLQEALVLSLSSVPNAH